MSSCDDPYRLLGIPVDATQAQIRTAFKALAIRTHPDKKHATVRKDDDCSTLPDFCSVVAAASLLLDPLQRAQYDGKRLHQAVRSEGRVSGTLDGSEITIERDEEGGLVWVVGECRCGGCYRAVFNENVRRFVAECESCSLVVEMLLDT